MRRARRFVLQKKTLRDLRDRKGSVAALVTILAVGVGCFSAMDSVWRDMDRARKHYYEENRLAHFSVDLKRAPAGAIASLEEVPGVLGVRGRIVFSVRLDIDGPWGPISGKAISLPERRVPVLNDVLLRRGTWFSGRGRSEAILNDAFAEAHGLEPGSRLRALLLDKEHDLLVVGTAMSPEFVYLIPEGGGLAPDPARFGVLYLPETFLREACDLRGAWNQVIGTVEDPTPGTLDCILDVIEDRLDPYGVTASTPIQDQASVRFLADELRGLRITALVLPALFLGVAALVLNVMLARLVAQQRAVIGTLKALGYSSQTVALHYLGHGVAIGALGGAAGVALGAWLQRATLGIYREFFALPSIEAHTYTLSVLEAVGIGVSFSALGALRGVRGALALSPAEAMRPPPPERVDRVLPEKIPFVWRRLSFQWKMILRAIFRNPFRSTVSVLAAVVSTALVLTALSNADALRYLMQYHFERISHEDLSVALRDPRGRRSLAEARVFPSVAGAEPQLQLPCDLSAGSRAKRAGVTGIVSPSRLHTPLDALGRPVVVPDSGLVLSRKLAESLDVEEGDSVRLRPLIGHRREATVPVLATVETFLGLSAYADLSYLSRLLGEEWSANVLLLEQYRGAEREDLLSELKARPTVTGVASRVRSLEQIEETFGETMGTMISIMLLFAGLIAFGSVLNSTLVSLSERQREVATLRVLGYTPGQVARIFSGESALLCLVGIAIGLLAGAGLAHLLSAAYDTELYRFPVVIHPSRLLHSLAIMVAFITLAQGIVHRLVRNLDWLEVLKVRE